MTHISYSILKLSALNMKPHANKCLEKHCKLNNRTICKFSSREEPTVYLDMFAGYLVELLETAVRTVLDNSISSPSAQSSVGYFGIMLRIGRTTIMVKSLMAVALFVVCTLEA